MSSAWHLLGAVAAFDLSGSVFLTCFHVFAARSRGATGPAAVANGSTGWTENEPSFGSGFGPLLPLPHPSLD